MHRLVFAGLFLATTQVHANPNVRMAFAHATTLHNEVPAAARAPRAVKLQLVVHEEDSEQPMADLVLPAAGPSLMEQVRERILEQLPVVSTAVVAPLPISSATGTLAGVGVLGRF